MPEQIDAPVAMRFGPALLLILILALPVGAAENWPDFRGPAGDGHSHTSGLPVTWSETENVTWKTAIPGRGWSSPVVWGDRVWMTTATADGGELFALAVDKRTGKVLHHAKVFDVQQPQEIDPLNSYASPSPVIESGRVWVHFGTYGTACLDTATAEVLWKRRDFQVDHQKGPGSSPVLYGDLLIFQCDGNDVQYMVALDKTSGKTVWKTARSVDLSRRDPDYRKSFSTPFVLQHHGKVQLVSTAAGAVFAYDPRSGRELWRVRYGGHTNVSRPVAGHGMVLINTGFPRPELWAVRLGGSGDVTPTHVAWKVTRGVSTKPSVILADDLVYMVSDKGGVVTCLEAKTGQTVWQKRLGGNYSASGLLAGGRLYFFSQEGATTVIEPGRVYRELAVNRLDEGFMASPAGCGTSLYLRTRTHLYRID